MASEQKAFASLSSGLLARKGAARPAMRPQGFGGTVGSGLEDLGWNDMGFEPPKPAVAPIRDLDHDAFGEELPEEPVKHAHAGLTPVQSPVHSQQAEIVERFSDGDEEVDEEEIDETAELYEPEAEVQGEEEESAAPVFEQAEPIFVEVAAPMPTPVSTPQREFRQRSAPGSKSKAAFTLRLDPGRHLKLRLACAVGGRSAQQLVTDALDQLLSAMPELDDMAEKAKRKE